MTQNPYLAPQAQESAQSKPHSRLSIGSFAVALISVLLKYGSIVAGETLNRPPGASVGIALLGAHVGDLVAILLGLAALREQKRLFAILGIVTAAVSFPSMCCLGVMVRIFVR